MQTQQKSIVNPLVSIIIGLLLLLPAGHLAVNLYVNPAIDTFNLSMTDSKLIGDANFVGGENYTRLSEDARLSPALSYTLQLMLSRMAIVAIVPVLVGVLMGLQGRIGRSINRAVLGIVVVVVSPVALTILWSVYWGQLWGTQPSPVWPPPESQMLSSPDGARNAIFMLDGAMTAVIALVVGGTAYMGVMRGRRGKQWPLPAMIGVWLVGLILAGSSAFVSFTLPYILTNGGPASSTTTFMLYQFKVAFERFQMGYAAAMSTLMIAGGLFAGLLMWLVLVALRLRIRYTTDGETPTWGRYLLVLTIPLALLIAYPLLSLILWGNGLVESNGGLSAVLQNQPWSQANNNSFAPLVTIWFVQIPVVFLAGFALGFLRPFGRIGSNILFLLFLLALFIPSEALHIAWYSQLREAQLLNTADATTLPWMISALSLIVFKLFFDGAYERYAEGETDANHFMRVVLLPSLPFALLVGAALSFMSLQAFVWPLVVTNVPENYTLTTLMMVQRGALSGNNLSLVGLALVFLRGPGIVFAVVFAVLQVLFMDRLAIMGGKGAPPAA